MKIIKNIFVCTIMSVSLVTTGYGHSGRTDANGGHQDRSTGTYHYHNGGTSSTKSTSTNTSSIVTKQATVKPTVAQYTDLQNLYVGGGITDIGVKQASNGTVYVQNTRFFNKFGYATQWFAESGTVKITKENDRIVLTSYSNIVFVNGVKQTIEQPTVIIDNIMYTPLKPFIDVAGGINNIAVKDVSGNLVEIK